MLFDVILKNQLPAEKERIKLEYDQIRLVKRTNTSELRRSETDPNVFYQSEEDSIIYRNPKGRGLFSDTDEVEENDV
ncbi:hypothetical protein [Rudanella paleaurantiibacter]|uniref:hypothetical protein n=1 Tax=Rudanella paleaurantiibacter TaxID=2614655 RepID=UPI00162764E0|nr:hypothetical protein [Rudanella paleaurantiibacter]